MLSKLTKSSTYFELKAQLESMQKECSYINMTDEFAKYARLQRKIIKIQDELKNNGMDKCIYICHSLRQKLLDRLSSNLA